ncbi:family 43 glycosylhydrolase [Plebeiibacterium marinum]|uniref:Family 43 glycosylhydrolase n=1 Tax=Plebeiibacterium marinum TaxID=2992111 RepID=A0AAE3SKT9_9BACT|nr:family 43 glycosylhydrolase [Plebeiobacterium marinum]MCW3806873.1 family 43 glycosylhydrolase [Plebeiobacterium marinum]
MKHLRILILQLTLLLCTINMTAQWWHNPLILPNEWELYGIGDPYLLKYNGRYYLYSSTRDNLIGVKCWSSKDLVNWDYEGLVTTEDVTKTAYAPEVIFYQGDFYMYTSPDGKGHYILKSESPTGPFSLITPNLGLEIDGSVFIEDNGDLYFYRADHAGIIGHKMSSPSSIGTAEPLNVNMNGWTEGPCVVKRNGVYYLQYTGNHVISPGYRINYARSSEGPLTGFEAYDERNPFVVSSEGDFIGLGHGSMFLGPDLDSHYITYHNKAGDFGVGPFRHINFDRIAWNGEAIHVLGPTTFDKPVPEMPYFYDYFERTEIGLDWQIKNGNWNINLTGELNQNNLEVSNEDIILISETPENTYTAEFNLKLNEVIGSDSYYGIVYDYTDDNNYCLIAIKPTLNSLITQQKLNGSWTNTKTYTLTGVAEYSKWQTIRIEKHTDKIKLFVNNMQKAQLDATTSLGSIGLTGYKTNSSFGFCAYSNHIDGRSIFNSHKPIPGTIQAIHYNPEEQTGFYESNMLDAENFRGDKAQVLALDEGDYALGMITPGNWYQYNVNVGYSADYTIGIKYAANTECTLRFSNGNGVLGEATIPSTGSITNYQTCVIPAINLAQGLSTIKIEVVSGELALKHMVFEQWESVVPFSDSFESSFPSWNYLDGGWAISTKEATIEGTGKITTGSTHWSNYIVEVDVKYSQGMNGGLIFRVKNPAQGGIGNDPQAGADFLQGYYFSLTSTGTILGKHNYNWKTLASSTETYQMEKWYHLKVEVRGANIKAYVDDMQNPVIDYTDETPFITGKVGLRNFLTTARYDNFMVYDIDSPSSILTDDVYYTLIAEHSAQAMSMQNETSDFLVQKPLAASGDQQYLAIYLNDYWIIQNYSNHKVVAPVGDNIEGSKAGLIQLINDPSVFWDFEITGEGLYKISNKQSNLSLAVADASQTTGSDIVLQTYQGDDHQKWRLKRILPDELVTDMASNKTVEGFNLFPNPAKDIFEIKAGFSIHKIEIYTASGRLIKQYQANKTMHFTGNCSDLVSGIYLIKVIGEQDTKTQQLVVNQF